MRLLQSLAMGCALATLSLVLTPPPAHAETDPAQESNRLTRPSDTIVTLGDGLFGDSVDLYNGTTTFDTVDISIPGNNKLPVSLGRHLDAVTTDLYGGLPSFANWEVDVPYLTGYFSEAGWTGTAGGILNGTTPTTNRCSLDGGTALAIPPAIYKGQYLYGQNYWSGNQMYVPGQGTQEMLLNSNTAPNISPRPTTGPAAHWITRKLWTFSCLSSVTNGTGEGFLATSPDGTQYYFDRIMSRTVANTDTRVHYTIGDVPYIAITHRQKDWILASHAIDRFGNTVTWNYNTSNQLTSITASDGRSITLTWTDGTISAASDGTHTWNYGYSANTPDPNDTQNLTRLTSVELPDDSTWTYGYSGILVMVDASEWIDDGPEPKVSCNGRPIVRHAGATAYPYTPFTLTAKHPSGATGVFVFKPLIRGRSFDPHPCTLLPTYPKESEQFALFSKTIDGPGLDPLTWTYSYSGTEANDYDSSWTTSVCDPSPCTSKVWTNVQNPDGSYIQSIFGNKFGVTEGQLKEVITYADSSLGTVLDDAITTYWGHDDDQPFPQYIGISPQFRANIFLSQEQHPQLVHTDIRSGATFKSTVNTYDAYANPLSTTRASPTLGFSRTDVAAYDNNTDVWVLGQPKSLTNSDTGRVVYSRTYDHDTALVSNVSRYGQLEASYTYFPSDDSQHEEGNLHTIKDGNDHITTFADYYRGVPQSLTFPDATVKSATVDSLGRITSITDAIGTTPTDHATTTTTTFGYDAMNRLASIVQPTGPQDAWTSTTISFVPVMSTAEHGLDIGHWKQTITTGTAIKVNWFDAFWQPVLTEDVDSAHPTTARYTASTFDYAGRKTFSSYPVTTIGSFDGTNGSGTRIVNGVVTTYDGIGRPTNVSQDADGGPLNTSYVYYSPLFLTQVTNPRGKVTTTSYQAFDTPDTSHPVDIASPANAETTITRDVFGKPLTITRSDSRPDHSSVSVTRNYVYDTQERLCKRVEPETGATLMNYDDANNVVWSVTGSTLTTVGTAAQCETDRGSVPLAAKTIHTYDERDRPLTVDVPHSSDDIAYSYFNDGALQTLTNGTNTWSYAYNKRRLPLTEQLVIDGRTETIAHGYDALGQESSLTYPSGLVVTTAPNALGQPAQATNNATLLNYAAGVSYFPNGGMSTFTYGNGIVHTLTQNLRQLPLRSLDKAPGPTTPSVLDDTYTYDENGNVTEIDDGTSGNPNTRTMTYDALDRLTEADAPNQPWVTAHMTYDALDNLLTNYVVGRHNDYSYDSNNRLSLLTNHGTGATVMTFGYDANGNITSKGSGLDTYTFDAANRLQKVTGVSGDKESYAYDGYGRRVKVTTLSGINIGKIDYPVYTMGGTLLTDDDQSTNNTTDYISLNGSLIAKSTSSIGLNTWTTTYEHTDALHSPITETDATGYAFRVERYTPFGEPSDGSYTQGPGFTGHITDALTGLTYAQQRYYDPVIGRFLSADPMQADDNGGDFNRYWYANNNPYRFTDPDGRQGWQVPTWLSNALYGQPSENAAQHQMQQAMASDLKSDVDNEIRTAPQQAKTAASLIATAAIFSPVGDVALAGLEARGTLALAEEAIDTVKVAGIDMDRSVGGARSALNNAGYVGEQVTNKSGTETGTLHNVASMKMDVRVMDGGPNHPPRISATRQGTSQPVNPANGRNFGNISRSEQRTGSHITLHNGN